MLVTAIGHKLINRQPQKEPQRYYVAPFHMLVREVRSRPLRQIGMAFLDVNKQLFKAIVNDWKTLLGRPDKKAPITTFGAFIEDFRSIGFLNAFKNNFLGNFRVIKNAFGVFKPGQIKPLNSASERIVFNLSTLNAVQ